MIKEALEYLFAHMHKPSVINVDGVGHYYNPVTGVVSKINIEHSKPLRFKTLSGLSEYVKDSSHWHGEEAFIHIQSTYRVQVVSNYRQGMKERFVSAYAEMDDTGFCFDHWYPVKSFHIDLRKSFVNDDHLNKLIQLCSDIRVLQNKDIEDDGVSQTVTVKKGVLSKNQTLPSTITLKPWRTFREIEQPSSTFFLRLRGDAEDPRMRLIELNCGLWELEAIEKIKAFMLEKVTEMPVLG